MSTCITHPGMPRLGRLGLGPALATLAGIVAVGVAFSVGQGNDITGNGADGGGIVE